MSPLKRFAPLIILAVLMGLAFLFDLHKSLSFAELQAQKDAFQAYTTKRPLLSLVIFTGVYIAFVALSLPIASLLTLLGGFLFGVWIGTFVVVTSATIGATIVFLIARTSLGATLREKAGTLYTKIEGNMNENALGYLLFMRLVPLFPFFLVNIVPALFNVSLRLFVITTFLGILPGSAVYVYAGQRLGEIEKPSDIFSLEILSAFVLLGLFAMIPTIYKQIREKKKAVSH